MKNLIFSITIFTFTTVVFANTKSPYAGQQEREMKALSQHEIAGYLNGKGLGYAKVAELNHFPGPKHVLDLASQLELTDEKVEQTKAIFKSMKSQAMILGEQFISKERELESHFSNASIDANRLQSLVSEIGVIEANIRYVHLKAHLKQKALMTKHQIHLYDQLRGYKHGEDEQHRHSHQHH